MLVLIEKSYNKLESFVDRLEVAEKIQKDLENVYKSRQTQVQSSKIFRPKVSRRRGKFLMLKFFRTILKFLLKTFANQKTNSSSIYKNFSRLRFLGDKANVSDNLELEIPVFDVIQIKLDQAIPYTLKNFSITSNPFSSAPVLVIAV